MQQMTQQPAMEKPDAGGAIGVAAPTIATIAAELATRRAELATSDGHGLALVRDLEQSLGRSRPRNAREAAILAAVAFARVRDTDEVGGVLHTEACALLARLSEWIEAAAGITAADLGLGAYTAGRDAGPGHSADDGGVFMLDCLNRGYLAAVARYAPTFYAFVKAEIDRTGHPLPLA